MKEKFVHWSAQKRSLEALAKTHTILDRLQEMGYTLTIRQLYYQLVANDIIPNNTSEYNRLINLLSSSRLGGYTDWMAIEDRLRITQSNAHWEKPKDVLDSALRSYYKDHWVDQDNYIEVWCEKDAVSNIIQPVCSEYDVTFLANRGYISQSAMYRASKRFKRAIRDGKYGRIIYFGDHDPSGMDMSRDIQKRMVTFLGLDVMEFELVRAALNMDQIEKYNPPENPAKETDSRHKKYVEEFGESSWELDALDAPVLADIVRINILNYLDKEKFDEVEKDQQGDKDKIRNMIDNMNISSTGWISIEDELPFDSYRVLVDLGNEDIRIGYYEDGNWSLVGLYDIEIDNNIIRWCNIPE